MALSPINLRVILDLFFWVGNLVFNGGCKAWARIELFIFATFGSRFTFSWDLGIVFAAARDKRHIFDTFKKRENNFIGFEYYLSLRSCHYYRSFLSFDPSSYSCYRRDTLGRDTCFFFRFLTLKTSHFS